jgi:ion channel-forming bestrophin family protein
MIEYNRKSWWKNAFSWRGTALAAAGGRVLLFTIYGTILQWAYETGAGRGWVSSEFFRGIDPAGHTVVGSLIGFLIVFRMNASNLRYWEGRTLWGATINASRNLVRMGAEYTKTGSELAARVTAYVICVRRSLQGMRDSREADIYLTDEQSRQVQEFGNTPTGAAALVSEWIHERYRAGEIDIIVLRMLEEQMSKLVDAQGGCERIQKTPLPFVYVTMIKQIMLVYLLTLPVILCARCGWWSPVLLGIISLGLLGMEEASVEIEDPFGADLNCLDMTAYTLTIARDVGQLGRRAERRDAALASNEPEA